MKKSDKSYTETNNNAKMSDEQYDLAKRMYMDYTPVKTISDTVGISRHSIYYHIKKDWEHERNLMKAEIFSAMGESKRVDFTRMTQSTIKIMTRALEALSKRDEPPSMKEATQASDILATLDKITRLDDGNPTDIVSNQEKPLTIETVRKKLAVDPFANDIAEIDYKEIVSEEESKDIN